MNTHQSERTPLVLRPAVYVMRRTRMGTKITAIALSLLVPMMLVLAMLIAELYGSLKFTRGEMTGLETVNAMTTVVVQLQAHRGQTNRLLSGDEGVRGALDKTRASLRESLRAVDALSKRYPDLQLASRWPEEQSAIEALLKDAQPEQRAVVFGNHSAAVTRLQKLAFFVGDTSGLLFDPQAASYFVGPDLFINH